MTGALFIHYRRLGGFIMRLQLNRKEVRELRRFINTIESIQGLPRAKYLEDFKVSKRAYFASMVSGHLNVEIDTDMMVEYLQLSSSFISEVAPTIKSIYNMGMVLQNAASNYETKFIEFSTRCDEDVDSSIWRINSIKAETIDTSELGEDVLDSNTTHVA